MPKKLERALEKSAEAAGIKRGSKRWDKYVYGSLAEIKKARKEKSHANR